MGEEVGLRAVKEDSVTVKTPRLNAEGEVVGSQDLETHRNRWIIEKRAFFEARATAADLVRDPKVDPKEAVKLHPELASTFIYLKGAQELAAQKIRDPQDQKKFVAVLRNALADSVERGEPLQPVRLREKAPRPAREEQTPNRSRDEDRTR